MKVVTMKKDVKNWIWFKLALRYKNKYLKVDYFIRTKEFNKNNTEIKRTINIYYNHVIMKEGIHKAR